MVMMMRRRGSRGHRVPLAEITACICSRYPRVLLDVNLHSCTPVLHSTYFARQPRPMGLGEVFQLLADCVLLDKYISLESGHNGQQVNLSTTHDDRNSLHIGVVVKLEHQFPLLPPSGRLNDFGSSKGPSDSKLCARLLLTHSSDAKGIDWLLAATASPEELPVPWHEDALVAFLVFKLDLREAQALHKAFRLQHSSCLAFHLNAAIHAHRLHFRGKPSLVARREVLHILALLKQRLGRLCTAV
mmetsp:Transcript_28392/g.65842  ORF Transcript_28392/g.65842 Transcript_28392/m.65842 type:complete len:244 (+) Transcript_28392:1205-1936(+)